MATPKDRTSIITVIPDLNARTLTFRVHNGRDGAERKTVGETILDLNRVHRDNVNYAAFHGFKQRIADKAALSRDTKTGLPASPTEKLEAMSELVDHFNSGTAEWKVKGAGRIGSDEALLARALQELFPAKDADTIRSQVAGWTKSQRTAMRLRPEVKVVIDRLEQEQVADVDTDDLLAAL